MRPFFLGAVALVFVCVGPSLHAYGQYAAGLGGDPSIYQRLAELEAEVQELKRQQDSGHPPFSPASHSFTESFDVTSCPTCNVPCDHCSPTGGAGGGGAAAAAAKKYPSVQLTGFFHLDTAWFNQDPVNIASVGDANDGISFRRTRLAAKGNVADNTSYIVEMDFAASQAQFVDVWLTQSDLPVLGNVRIGRWRQPFGMSTLTGIRELPFMERAIPFALVPFRQTGIGAFDTALDERLTWAVSAFRFNSDFFGNNSGDNGGYAMAGRITGLPFYVNDNLLLHLGIDYSFQDPSNDSIRYFTAPEILLDQATGPFLAFPNMLTPAFADTGMIAGVDKINVYGAEIGGAIGRLYLQSETYWSEVNLGGGGTLRFPGAYAQARYMLTGETIPYNKKNGVFGRVKPSNPFDPWNGGWGAWELAARWSYLDLNDAFALGGGGSLPGGVRGGRLTDVTLGVNWYFNDFTKFQFNYIHANLGHPVLGNSDADILAVRAQLDF